jgi:chemotaxis protein CheD
MPRDAAARPISLSGLKAPVVVGLGEAHALRADPSVEAALVAYGLGSCIALCLWDAEAHVAGMAHIVVPGEDPNRAPNPRFARSALPALISVMRAYGSRGEPRRLIARLVGGAHVLPRAGRRGLAPVGDANSRALREALSEAGVAIHAHDLGGDSGRSVWFDPRDGGQVRVRSIGCDDRYL